MRVARTLSPAEAEIEARRWDMAAAAMLASVLVLLGFFMAT